MSVPYWFNDDSHNVSEVLWEDGDRVLRRRRRNGSEGGPTSVLVVSPTAEHPTPAILKRLAHEYELKDDLENAWAARPFALERAGGDTLLVLEDPGGQPLDRLIGPPMEVGRFLRLAIALTVTLGQLHERGLLHKDIKPTNILVNSETNQAWLLGFGIASRLPRERLSPEASEFISGTLAYIPPEQTGRMNRSVDSRSDLYSLGVTLYQMLTGRLPFTASDPMEWVHCHIARKPVPPSEFLKNIPIPVSAIILKLLAKTAEERYQTAAGLESDLRRVLEDWGSYGRVDVFPLGQNDVPEQLLIPEKLYGREGEVNILLTTFERVAQNGTPELVLVSGYSGVGKSSVVNELHKAMVPTRGLFASCKFDQYKRDVPYATLARAFASLVRPLLTKSEVELTQWRDALRGVLYPNGKLIADLIPELKLIIGEQPPVPELPPQDEKGRFHLVCRRFINVLARAQHPLVLFLDDLQWLDVATLDLLENLLTHPDVRYLMVIGAYRDNEVASTHPLIRKLETMRLAGVISQNIILEPLTRKDLGQLIADALRCDLKRGTPLAQLILDKTGGNAFFVIQFISALTEEGLLTLDCGQWSWDLNRIRAKRYTDNVVDLILGKLNRLPIGTQNALKQLACLGNMADFLFLRAMYPNSDEDIHSPLWEAVRAGLIFRSEDSYRFLHDRVEEATYSLIPQELRAESHLRIGRLLAERIPSQEHEEKIFDIVNQFNRATHLITSNDERRCVARFNLIAARRAKRATGYASALAYLVIGRTLLTEECWLADYDLIFSLECLAAECELLAADMESAEKRLSMLATLAKRTHDLAIVTRLQLMLYTASDRLDRGVEICLDYLRREGTNWSAHPTDDDVRCEYDQIWSLLGDRKIEDLFDLPLVAANSGILDVLEVLTEIVTLAVFFDKNLCALVICRIVNLSLEHGNSDGSCFAYVMFGIVIGPRFGCYNEAFRLGQVGYDLLGKRSLKRYEARTCLCFCVVIPWTRHARHSRDLLRHALDVASEVGDFTYAAYSFAQLVTSFLFVGDNLTETQAQAEKGVQFATSARVGLVVDAVRGDFQLIRTLRGLTDQFGTFDDEGFNEDRFEEHLADNPALAHPSFGYWTLKAEARFFAGNYCSAVDASLHAQELLWASPALLESAAFRFYGALSHAAAWDGAKPDDRAKHFETLATHHKQLEIWAELCSDNFKDRAALVGAEIARIEGRELDAERLYERAINSAQTSGFVHNEAVANELAARFYMARGFDKIGNTYLRDARDCYLQWGADGKVRQLDSLYPQLRHGKPPPDPTSTILASVEQLDLATVINLSQIISGELVLERLVDTLMRLAIQNAGAERGLLILIRGDDYQIVAEAAASIDGVTVNAREASASAAELPVSVLHYIARTKESVLLHDASGDDQFLADDYVHQKRARSILCLPLLRETTLVGVLYLENNLAANVFTADRIVVLKVLATQAAISLENTRLYDELRDREGKIRRLFDSNIIGLVTWRADGRIIDANDTFLRMVGYGREAFASGLRWQELTPPEWRAVTEQRLLKMQTNGVSLPPYEKEYIRKDGSRVPVLIGDATFERKSDGVVAFVLDLTEQKRAERAYAQTRTELTHANRVTTMGHLTASIAHEINQPIGAAVAYANAGLNWLGRKEPNVEEACRALGHVVEAGIRAGAVVDRIRAMVKKAPPRSDAVDVNELVREIIELTRREIARNAISTRLNLTEGLPGVVGDRVQLQQVVLNLVMNAIEAMSMAGKEHRELVVSSEKSASDGVLVAVRDSGPGIAPESAERLYESFYTTKPGGLGMGLSICHSIIEAHRGRLWVTGNTPEGAVFQFTLPAK